MSENLSDLHRRMKKRNVAVAAALLGFVFLVFVLSIAKMGVGN